MKIEMSTELRAWLAFCYWVMFFCVAGPFLISIDSTLAVVAGIAMFVVGIRVTAPFVITQAGRFFRWVDKEFKF